VKTLRALRVKLLTTKDSKNIMNDTKEKKLRALRVLRGRKIPYFEFSHHYC